MKKQNKILKKIEIAPCFGTSEKVNDLKTFIITIKVMKNKIVIAYKGGKLMELSNISFHEDKLSWYGDLIMIKGTNEGIKNPKSMIGVKNKIIYWFVDELKYRYEIKRFKLWRFGIRVKQTDSKTFQNIFTKSIEWQHKAPKCPKISYENLSQGEWKCLWENIWVYHRFNMFQPEKVFKKRWISPCRVSEYQKDMLAMWDTLHIIEDLKYYKVELALDLLGLHYNLIRESDGMWAQDQKIGRVWSKNPLIRVLLRTTKSYSHGMGFKISQPPIWSITLRNLLEGRFIPNLDKFIEKTLPHYLKKMEKNIKWWEMHRYFPELNLFGYNDIKINKMSNESGLDNSPRFINQYTTNNSSKDGNWIRLKRSEVRKLACVDLSAQMYTYYENMKFLIKYFKNMGGNYQIEKAEIYGKKAERLKKAIMSQLWDDEHGFFFDYDLDTQSLQPLKASSHFWVFYILDLEIDKIEKMLKHLLSPDEFNPPLPIPTISQDSDFFGTDMWQGPSWISQNYWILKGLKQSGKPKEAKELTLKVLGRLTEFNHKYRKIFEFYPADSLKIERLERKGSSDGPHPHYIGHFPIHSMWYDLVKTY